MPARTWQSKPHTPAHSRWAGQYELSFSLGRINDSTEVFAEYFLSIGRDSVSFIANGYKIYWDYLCTAREQDGRLIILCDRLTDGFGNLTAGDTLAIVTFDAGRYYLESPVVYDNPNATDFVAVGTPNKNGFFRQGRGVCFL